MILGFYFGFFIGKMSSLLNDFCFFCLLRTQHAEYAEYLHCVVFPVLGARIAGGFGLLMLPWSIKVFWAPLVDRYGSKATGHYRSWIIPLQLLSVAVLIALSFLPIQALDQPVYLLAFFIALLFMNGVGATQDIATDALAVNILKNEQQHWGNTFQVIGSRLGFIVGGGAILLFLDLLQWQSTFLLLAALVFINTLPVLKFKEPQHRSIASEQITLADI